MLSKQVDVPWLPPSATRTAALSDAVRRRRESLGLRQEDLADLAGCSERFVHTVEAGKASLRFDKLLDVLGILGLTLVVDSGNGSVRLAPGVAGLTGDVAVEAPAGGAA